MEIRRFKQEYEKDIVNLWNRCCTANQIDLNQFRRQALYDDNFDENLVWCVYDRDRLIGFIMATKRKFPYMERGLEPDRGWINVLFVEESHRRQKIGTQLLSLAEAELKKRGAKNITLGAYSPGYFFPGIDEQQYEAAAQFFQHHYYQRKETHFSMGMKLTDFHIPEKIEKRKGELEKQGYRFIEFDEKYSLELLNFLKSEFGGGWKRNALMAMRNGTSGKLILIVLNPNDEICGFCMHAIDENPERFGPIGISKTERNANLGSVLLHLKLKKMKDHGCEWMFFMTTDENGRRFYERNGLELIRNYTDYRKEI